MNEVDLPTISPDYNGSAVMENNDTSSSVNANRVIYPVTYNNAYTVQKNTIENDDNEDLVKDIEESNYKSILTPTF